MTRNTRNTRNIRKRWPPLDKADSQRLSRLLRYADLSDRPYQFKTWPPMTGSVSCSVSAKRPGTTTGFNLSGFTYPEALKLTRAFILAAHARLIERFGWTKADLLVPQFASVSDLDSLIRKAEEARQAAVPIEAQNILRKYLDEISKRCPNCKSLRISSGNTSPLMHRCLDCGHIFSDMEALAPDPATKKETQMKYTCTYLTHPDIDSERADPEGSVRVEASSMEEAARIALSMPLPARADNLEIHVAADDLSIPAGTISLEAPREKGNLATALAELAEWLKRTDQSLTGQPDSRVHSNFEHQQDRLLPFATGDGDGDSQLYYLSDGGYSRLLINPETGEVRCTWNSSERIKWLTAYEHRCGVVLRLERAAETVRIALRQESKPTSPSEIQK